MKIYTDGGAINNGKRNCKAAWSVFFGYDDPRNSCDYIEKKPSNQIAELYAIYVALTFIKNEVSEEGYTIISDSKYSIDCLTKWYKSWEKNGWKTAKKEPVKHSEIIKECCDILYCSNNRNISFRHINSHQIPPKERSSEEWEDWFGNFNADKMVTEKLRDNKEIVITIDWNGNVVDDEDSITRTEKKRISKENNNTKEDDKTVVVVW